MESTTSACPKEQQHKDQPHENGHIRYNTPEEVFELYEEGAWRNVRLAEPF